MKAIAVTSLKRSELAPEVPTVDESGVKGFEVSVWFGVVAPSSTPRDIVSRLNRELVKALESPDIREKLTAQGVEPWPGTPEQLAELLRADIEMYGTIVRSARLPRQ